MDIARTSMIHAHAPHFLWPYVVRYAAHQLILQSRVSWPEASPTSLWTRSLGVGSAFRVLDCLALVCDTSADKLSARAIPCVFLGFPMDSPDYGFYHPPLHQFLDSSDVQFDDSMSYYARYPCQGLPVPPPPLYLAPSPSPAPVPPVPPPPPGAAIEGTRFGGALLRSARAGGHGTGGASSGGAGAGGASAGGASSGGAGAGGASAGGAGDGGAGAGGSSSGGAGAGDAGAGGVSFGGAGVGGTGTGGASSEETGAGGTTPAPPHRHDTRLADTLRELLHVAAQRNYELHSLDFSTAFLQASLHEEIWLCRPPGFTGTFSHGTQWSLGRPVYGLCQAPCKWHDMLCTTLAALKFPDRAALAEVKSKLQKRHTCTDLGELRRYLGLQITRERAARTITLSQSHMVQQVLQQFGLQHSTTQPTALSVDHRLTGPFPDEPFESSGPYAELVGCLMVAKYLVTTSTMGLVLGGRLLVVLTGHCDSSYAYDVETQRSTQGYCFSLGARAMSWRSTRSSSVASSSAEAELYAGAMAAQELRWLTFLLADVGERPRSAPTLFSDNKAMILLCREPRLESRVKHIDVSYFLLQELQQRGQARLDFVVLEANTADIFTKALAPSGHHRFCLQLGLVDAGARLL
ncbi:unnamed protein product [Closterium sp. NIES-54]